MTTSNVLIRKNKRTAVVKIFSSILLITFFIQEISFAVPDATEETSKVWAKQWLPVIPTSVAVIGNANKAIDSNKTIVLIQDAHTNGSGQLNVVRALDIIMRKRPIKYVFLEAGSGDESLSFLRKYASESKRKRVARSFMREGALQGSEYLDLTSAHDLVLWGVEDLALYAKSVETYRAVAKQREELGRYLAKINITAQALKPSIYNPFLLAFDAKYQRFQKETTALTDYFELLLSEADRAGVPLSAYPHLRALRELKRVESRIDFEKASEEERSAIESLSTEDRKDLLSASKEDQTISQLSVRGNPVQKAFFALLEERTASSLSRYPELAKYFHYLKEAGKLDARNVLDEQKALEGSIFKALAHTPDEEELIAVSKNSALMKKLFDLTMTPDEYREYQEQDLDISHLMGFLNKKIMDLGKHHDRAVFLGSGVERMVRKCEEFYALTYERDRRFIENLTQKMDAESQREAVLITGGYHTPNLEHLLKERGVSFISLTPQVLNETNQKRYERILLGSFDAGRNSVSPGGTNSLRMTAATNMEPRTGRWHVAKELSAPFPVISALKRRDATFAQRIGRGARLAVSPTKIALASLATLGMAERVGAQTATHHETNVLPSFSYNVSPSPSTVLNLGLADTLAGTAYVVGNYTGGVSAGSLRLQMDPQVFVGVPTRSPYLTDFRTIRDNLQLSAQLPVTLSGSKTWGKWTGVLAGTAQIGEAFGTNTSGTSIGLAMSYRRSEDSYLLASITDRWGFHPTTVRSSSFESFDHDRIALNLEAGLKDFTAQATVEQAFGRTGYSIRLNWQNVISAYYARVPGFPSREEIGASVRVYHTDNWDLSLRGFVAKSLGINSFKDKGVGLYVGFPMGGGQATAGVSVRSTSETTPRSPSVPPSQVPTELAFVDPNNTSATTRVVLDDKTIRVIWDNAYDPKYRVHYEWSLDLATGSGNYVNILGESAYSGNFSKDADPGQWYNQVWGSPGVGGLQDRLVPVLESMSDPVIKARLEAAVLAIGSDNDSAQTSVHSPDYPNYKPIASYQLNQVDGVINLFHSSGYYGDGLTLNLKSGVIAVQNPLGRESVSREHDPVRFKAEVNRLLTQLQDMAAHEKDGSEAALVQTVRWSAERAIGIPTAITVPSGPDPGFSHVVQTEEFIRLDIVGEPMAGSGNHGTRSDKNLYFFLVEGTGAISYGLMGTAPQLMLPTDKDYAATVKLMAENLQALLARETDPAKKLQIQDWIDEVQVAGIIKPTQEIPAQPKISDSEPRRAPRPLETVFGSKGEFKGIQDTVDMGILRRQGGLRVFSNEPLEGILKKQSLSRPDGARLAMDVRADFLKNVGRQLPRKFDGRLPLAEERQGVRVLALTKDDKDILVVVDERTMEVFTYDVSAEVLEKSHEVIHDFTQATDITDETFDLRDANDIAAYTDLRPTAKVVLVDSFPDLPNDAFYQNLIVHFSRTLVKGSQVILVSEEAGKAQKIAQLAKTHGVQNASQFIAMSREELAKVELPTSYLLADTYLDQAKALYGQSQKYFRLQSPGEDGFIGVYALRPVGMLMDRVSLEDWQHAAELYSRIVGRNVDARELRALHGALLIPFVSKLIARLVAQVYMAERALGSAA